LPFRRTSISILFLTTILSLTSACSASAQMSCSDVKYGNPRYHENMDELAKRAGLPDNYWSRYDEDVVSALCSGNIKSVNQLIEAGSVKAEEAQAIAKVLGKTFKPRQQSEAGKSYAQAKSKFLEMGACSACADNIAQFYTKRPASTCGKLAKAALGGLLGTEHSITILRKRLPPHAKLAHKPIPQTRNLPFSKHPRNLPNSIRIYPPC